MWRRRLFATFFVVSLAAMPSWVDATELNVLLVIDDGEQASLGRSNKILVDVGKAWAGGLQLALQLQVVQQAGIKEFRIYRGSDLLLRTGEKDHTRLQDTDIMKNIREHPDPKIDVVVFYEVYVRAVKDPKEKIAMLQGSLMYRIRDSASGRPLGGDRYALPRSGVPLTGCAAQQGSTPPMDSCIIKFVTERIAELARQAGNNLALRMSVLLNKP